MPSLLAIPNTAAHLVAGTLAPRSAACAWTNGVASPEWHHGDERRRKRADDNWIVGDP
jgi:hypothetical protein